MLGADRDVSRLVGPKLEDLIVTSDSNEWLWMRDPEQIAKSLHALAEGEKVQLTKKAPGWMIAIYILAGMMAFEILFFLTVIVFDSF